MVERSAPIVTGTEMNSDSAADGTKAMPAARACEASLVVRRASSIICDAFSRRRLNATPTQKRARRKSATTRYVPAATALQGIEAGGEREVARVTVGAFVVVGCANAVNLTDGLDGLAIGPSIMNAGTFLIFAYIAGVETTIVAHNLGDVTLARYLHIAHIDGVEELAVFAAALFGAGVGFLWYNAYPAQVFMGDVGSLSLGGSIGMLAVLTKNELILLLVGGLFVIEALSVIIQVGSFKTRGKRVFRMAPIHHHYEKLGWDEPKIIVRFWLVSLLFALLALGTLKVR